MKDYIAEVKYYLGLYGELAGWIFVLFPMSWDVMMGGILGFPRVAVCWRGLCMMWAGVILIRFSRYFRDNF